MATNFSKEFWWASLHNHLSQYNVSLLLDYSSAKAEIYTGTQPVAVETGNATSQGATRLATINFSNGVFSNATDGILRLLTPLTANASASGTAQWARIFAYNSDNGGLAELLDTDVSVSGAGGGLILDSISLTAGQPVTIEKFALSLPEANGDLKLSLSLRNAILQEFGHNTGFNAPGNYPGKLDVYTGTPPASTSDTPPGTLLATFQPTSSNTRLWQQADTGTGEAIVTTNLSWTQAVCVAAGTPGWFRLQRESYMIQGTCGVSGTHLIVDKNSVNNGDTLTITEFTLKSS